MSVDTLKGNSNTYVLKNTSTGFTLPPGSYTTNSSASFDVTDSTGASFTIPSGDSKCTFPKGINAVSSISIAAPSKWTNGSYSGTAITPVGLVNDGGKFVAMDKTSKSIQSTDGKSWSALNTMPNTYATDADAPTIVFQTTQDINNTTVNLSDVAQNDVIVVFQYRTNDTVEIPTPTGFTTISQISYYGYKASYKVAGSTPDTSVSLNSGRMVSIVVLRGVKLIAGIPQFTTSRISFGPQYIFGATSWGSIVTAPLTRIKPGSRTVIFNGYALNNTTYSQSTASALPQQYALPSNHSLVNSRSYYYNGQHLNVSALSGTVGSDSSSIGLDQSTLIVGGINSGTEGSGYSVSLAFESASTPLAINSFTYANSKYSTYLGSVEKFANTTSTGSVWDYSGTSITNSVSPAAISYVGGTTGTKINSANATVSLPSNAAVNDFLILTMLGGGYPPVISGWTRTHDYGQTFYVKKASATDVASGIYIPGAYNNSSTIYYTLTVYRGVASYAFDSVSVTSSTSAVTPPPMYATAGSISFIFGSYTGGYNSWYPNLPAGYNTLAQGWNTAIPAMFGSGYKQITATGIETPGAITNFNTTSSLVATTFIMYPDVKTYKTIKYLNNAYFAAGATLATSSDAVTWTEQTNPLGTTATQAEYGNGKYVITGVGGKIAYSTNGTSWTLASSPTTSDITDLKFADGVFAMTTTGSTYHYSYDGITWSTANVPASTSTAPSVLWTKATGIGGAVSSIEFNGGLKKGDLVIVSVNWQGSASYLDINAPAGWTRFSAKSITSSVSYATYYKVMGDVVDSGFVTNGDTTMLTGTTSTYCYVNSIAAVAIRGIDPAANFIANVSTVSATTSDSPAVTTLGPSIVVAIQHGNTNATAVAPNGYSNLVYANSTNNGIALATKYVSSATTEDPSGWNTGGNSYSHALTIAVPVLSTSATSSTPRTLAYVKPYFIAGGDGASIVYFNPFTGAAGTSADKPIISDNIVASGTVGKSTFMLSSAGSVAVNGTVTENAYLVPTGGIVEL